MIKDLAWNAFKNTGNINTFLELKQIEKIQKENSNIVLNQEMQNIKEKIQQREAIIYERYINFRN